MADAPTPAPKPSTLSSLEADLHPAEEAVSRFHINGWLAIALILGANVVGILFHV